MKTFKIAFDAKRLFHNREGLGSYARTLVADLQTLYPQHQYYLFTPKASAHAYAEPFLDEEKFTIVTAEGKNAWYWRSRGIVNDLRKHGIDVYWGLSNELPFGLSQLPIKKVVTIHDMIYKTFPQQFTWSDRWIYQRKFSNAIKSADIVMAASDSTRRDILKYFKGYEDKVATVYQAVPPVFRNRNGRSSVDQHYLMVGSINERKNLDLVVEAYKLLDEADRRPVVIVGGCKGAYYNMISHKIKSCKLEPYFRFVGQVDEGELIRLYQASIALLFPSLYEGFGIPIIEALTVGIPVIGNDISSIPEILGKYGIIIEYDRAESLKEAILKMNDNNNDWAFDAKDVKQHLNQFNHQVVGQAILETLQLDKNLS